MPRRKRLTGRELIRALKKAGFVVLRMHGSHHRLKHPDGRITTVPVHAGETIGPGLLGQILRDCDLNQNDLDSLL
jgi:predicted RNA binding protein YcfA (HicA-like mRNA interferase family)